MTQVSRARPLGTRTLQAPLSALATASHKDVHVEKHKQPRVARSSNNFADLADVVLPTSRAPRVVQRSNGTDLEGGRTMLPRMML